MTPIPAEIDTGIPMDRKRSPLQPGRPEGAKAAGRAACLSLRRPREFCKPYRDRLLITLVIEPESRIASTTLAASPCEQWEALAHVLHLLNVVKRRLTRARRVHP